MIILIGFSLVAKTDPTVRSIVRNILDEPIPEAVKKRLLTPLLPQPTAPVRKRKLEKRKALLQEFDPLHTVTRCGSRRAPAIGDS